MPAAERGRSAHQRSAHDPASGLASFSFWTPLFGVMAGALPLGEPFSGLLGVAAAVVALGIYLVNRQPRPSPS